MAAGLAALRDDAVRARRDRAPRLVRVVTIASSGTPARRASGIAGVGSSKVVMTDAPAARAASRSASGGSAGGESAPSGGSPSSSLKGASTAAMRSRSPVASLRGASCTFTPTGPPPEHATAASVT